MSLLLTYTVPIRQETNAVLILPRDLTGGEALRLKALIDSLVIPPQVKP